MLRVTSRLIVIPAAGLIAEKLMRTFTFPGPNNYRPRYDLPLVPLSRRPCSFFFSKHQIYCRNVLGFVASLKARAVAYMHWEHWVRVPLRR